MDRLPFPDFALLREQATFELAMEAYARHARDNSYPYLAAWRPWLHVASQLRGHYSASQEVPPDSNEARFHFSQTMSTLRNRIISEIFGFDGVDLTATSLSFQRCSQSGPPDGYAS